MHGVVAWLGQEVLNSELQRSARMLEGRLPEGFCPQSCCADTEIESHSRTCACCQGWEGDQSGHHRTACSHILQWLGGSRQFADYHRLWCFPCRFSPPYQQSICSIWGLSSPTDFHGCTYGLPQHVESVAGEILAGLSRVCHAATSEAQGVGMEYPPLRECYNLEQQNLLKRDLDEAQLVHCSLYTLMEIVEVVTVAWAN